MPENQKNNQYDPTEKVARMNRIFDRLVLPMIVFTVLVFVGFAVIPKLSCAGDDVGDTSRQEMLDKLDAYTLREVLLGDLAANREIFEAGGYTVVDNESSGLVAYIALDGQTEIFDNITDSSGGHYSAVKFDDGQISLTVRIYSAHIFLVEAAAEGENRSAIFYDDAFTSYASDGDADAQSVYSIAPAERLAELVAMYKQSILALVE